MPTSAISIFQHYIHLSVTNIYRYYFVRFCRYYILRFYSLLCQRKKNEIAIAGFELNDTCSRMRKKKSCTGFEPVHLKLMRSYNFSSAIHQNLCLLVLNFAILSKPAEISKISTRKK